MKITNSAFTLLFIIIVFFISSININYNKKSWANICETDARGYFAYLPALFIYHDWQFGFFETIEQHKPDIQAYTWDYRMVQPNNKVVNKCYVGTALCLAPAFILTHMLVSILSPADADGFTKFYFISVAFSAIVFAGIGLFFLRKILIEYGFSDFVISLVLLLTAFASNMVAYVLVDAGMSHIYSFALVMLFYYHLLLLKKHKKNKYLIYLAVILGLLVLIRPTNAMAVLLFFVAFSSVSALRDICQYVLKNVGIIFLSFIVFAFIISIQFIIYQIQSDTFFVYSYGSKESFDFLHPHIFNFLFSYRKGFFIYTPIAFVSLWGVYNVFQENKFKALSILSFIALLVFVFSSWWSWWYGGSFSQRPMLDFWLVFALLLAYLIQAWQKKMKFLLFTTFIFCIFTQIQLYQYRYYEIKYDHMTKEEYWHNFMMRNRKKLI